MSGRNISLTLSVVSYSCWGVAYRKLLVGSKYYLKSWSVLLKFVNRADWRLYYNMVSRVSKFTCVRVHGRVCFNVCVYIQVLCVCFNVCVYSSTLYVVCLASKVF